MKMCAVRPIKYSEIIELDRKVREQLSMKTNIPTRPEIPYTAISLQGLLKSVFNEAGKWRLHLKASVNNSECTRDSSTLYPQELLH